MKTIKHVMSYNGANYGTNTGFRPFAAEGGTACWMLCTAILGDSQAVARDKLINRKRVWFVTFEPHQQRRFGTANYGPFHSRQGAAEWADYWLSRALTTSAK